MTVKSKGSFLFLLILAGILTGCFEPPEFSKTPEISFKNIKFKEVDEGTDSLILTFNFTDGDGDIGLNSEEQYAPFHSFDYIIYIAEDGLRYRVTYGQDDLEGPFERWHYGSFFNQNGDFIQQDWVYIGPSDFDGNMPAYGCEDYLINNIFTDENGELLSDTSLISKNEYNKNIYVDIFRKRAGEYIPINDEFSNGSCIEVFSARFPVFDNGNLGRALSGAITYGMPSQGFIPTFLNDSIKIDFFIFDRSLNRSNLASTPDFILSQIKRN